MSERAVALHRTWQANPERQHRSLNAGIRNEFLNELAFVTLADARRERHSG